MEGQHDQVAQVQGTGLRGCYLTDLGDHFYDFWDGISINLIKD